MEFAALRFFLSISVSYCEVCHVFNVNDLYAMLIYL